MRGTLIRVGCMAPFGGAGIAAGAARNHSIFSSRSFNVPTERQCHPSFARTDATRLNDRPKQRLNTQPADQLPKLEKPSTAAHAAHARWNYSTLLPHSTAPPNATLQLRRAISILAEKKNIT